MALICLVAATVLRGMFIGVGTDMRFATYFPALLVTGVLAGTPAAILLAIASTIIVWWAFIPPYFQFTPVTRELVVTFLVWAVSAGLLILFAHYFRLALQRLRRREREHALISKELEHRGRNTYAVIESIVQQTLGLDSEQANSILGRIRSVKYANDLIANQRSHSVCLDMLLLHEIAAFGEDRLQARGPTIEIAGDTARHLVLVLHELVTNSAKHGSLSAPRGKIAVNWQQANNRVSLEWREIGGPPVETPIRRGFGTKLVTQCVRALRGTIEPKFAESGFSCTLTFPLHG